MNEPASRTESGKYGISLTFYLLCLLVGRKMSLYGCHLLHNADYTFTMFEILCLFDVSVFVNLDFYLIFFSELVKKKKEEAST